MEKTADVNVDQYLSGFEKASDETTNAINEPDKKYSYRVQQFRSPGSPPLDPKLQESLIE